MTKIAVTGGAGYVGSALVEQLSHLPQVTEILIYDNLSSGNLDFFFSKNVDRSKVKFVYGDILETQKLKKLVTGVDAVVHLAGLDTYLTDFSSLHHLEQVNHWGTAELSYAVENSNVAKLIYLSTAEVYGYATQALTEESMTTAVEPHALSKLRGEGHITRLSGKIDTLVLRSGIITGWSPVKSTKGIANNLFYDAIIKKRMTITGSGKHIRPFVSIDFVVSSLISAILGPQTLSIINLVQANFQELDIVEAVKAILPETEFIFNNHHLELPNLILTTSQNDIFKNKEELNLQMEFQKIVEKSFLG